MKQSEDPRIKVSRRAFLLAWLFFSAYIMAVLAASFFLGIEPRLWGLPRWVAIGNILLPALFVLLLIVVIEKFIPDVSLTDERPGRREPE